nr:zinc finger protein 606-like [Aotus nancymaae]
MCCSRVTVLQGRGCGLHLERVDLELQLDLEQRTLDRDVMLEDCSHLLSVGCQVGKPAVIFRLEQGKEPRMEEEEEMDTWHFAGEREACRGRGMRLLEVYKAEPWMFSRFENESYSAGSEAVAAGRALSQRLPRILTATTAAVTTTTPTWGLLLCGAARGSQ